MKSALKGLFILALALGAADARASDGGQQTTPTPTPTPTPTFVVPAQISFDLELGEQSGPFPADSWWEISIQLHVADQSDFGRSLAQRKSGKTDVPEPGIILKKESFQLRDLSKEASRHIKFKLPVGDELRKRFMSIMATPQVLWITGTVHVHARKDDDIVSNEVTPTWNLRHFIDKDGYVRLTIVQSKQLTWSTGIGKSRIKQ